MEFTSYETYVFFLCFVVFVMLTTLSVICITIIARLSLKVINNGLEDVEIIKEYNKKQKNRKYRKIAKIADYALTGVVAIFFVVVLGFSVAIRTGNSDLCNILPEYHVVRSNSMSEKNEKNGYLYIHGLDNQIQMFDLVRTEKMPAEEDVQLYDIVVYEHEDKLIMHRIVEIEEPNDFHPDKRYFRLQGDALESGEYPIVYSQMLGVWRGWRVPYVGSFVMFMQSPAGWLCTLLIVITMIATPLLDKKLDDARKKRLQLHLDSGRINRETDRQMLKSGVKGGSDD